MLVFKKFPHQFLNANLDVVPYDGSQISWRVSAYVLIIKDGKLLLAKSKHEKLYDVLGGGIEIGETVEEALHREVLEEGGAKINIGKLQFSAVDWFYHREGKFYQTLQLYFEAELVGEQVAPTDPAMEWMGFVPIDEVSTKYVLAVSPPAKHLIEKYLSGLRSK